MRVSLCKRACLRIIWISHHTMVKLFVHLVFPVTGVCTLNHGVVWLRKDHIIICARLLQGKSSAATCHCGDTGVHWLMDTIVDVVDYTRFISRLVAHVFANDTTLTDIHSVRIDEFQRHRGVATGDHWHHVSPGQRCLIIMLPGLVRSFGENLFYLSIWVSLCVTCIYVSISLSLSLFLSLSLSPFFLL